MRTISKNTHHNDQPRQDETSELQTPDEGRNDDVAELVKIATSLAMELDKASKLPDGR